MGVLAADRMVLEKWTSEGHNLNLHDLEQMEDKNSLLCMRHYLT